MKKERMTAQRVAEAREALDKYRAGKAALDRRIIENQEWYKLRHGEPGKAEPGVASAWLLNAIANKHADAMDNIPAPVVLPREPGDRQDAELLSKVLPAVLEMNDFEEAYSRMWWRKLKTGTGAYGVFWDPGKLRGLGDIELCAVDILNLYWEPGVRDLQRSRYLFWVELADQEHLAKQYPGLKLKGGGDAGLVKQYVHEERIEQGGKRAVVDWYYREEGALHLCRFVGDQVLYASEDDPMLSNTGLYDHGLYPFVLDPLFPEEDGPTGFGYLDVCKDPQTRIDRLNQVILKNAMMAARPRYFIKGDGGVNEAEFADWQNDFVHYLTGGSPKDSIMPIETTPLPAGVLTVLRDTVEELKETSGNRDFNQGGTAAGVTAASAIAALQEAGSKLSRDMIKASYRSFVKVCELCLELIRQFYREPRCFRVAGRLGDTEYIRYDSGGMQLQAQGDDFGVPLGARLPVYDIRVKAQKASPFAVAAQNDLAREFYAAGFFDPGMGEQALACLDMMTFEGKEEVRAGIARRLAARQEAEASP